MTFVVSDEMEMVVIRNALRAHAHKREKDLIKSEAKGFVPKEGHRDVNREDLPIAQRLIATLNKELRK